VLKKRQYWFLVIEVIIYSSFLYLDFYSREYAYSNRLKFAGIFLCFFMTFLSLVLDKREKSDKRKEVDKEGQDCFLVFAAFFFTVGADILLLFTDAYWQGVVCFIIVQSIYFYRISILASEGRNSFYIRHLLVRICLGVLCNLIFLFCGIWEPVTCASSFYLISFVGNLYWLFKIFLEHKKVREKSWFLRFLSGMVLFFLCDICVGVYNLTDYLPFLTKDTARYLQYAGNLMWMFYLPGQVLLSLSGKDNKEESFFYSS